MHRKPVVAGQFYPGSKDKWLEEVRRYLSGGESGGTAATLSMVPHAGYPFSGGVAGRTLARARPGGRVLLLGPNHTGQGKPLAVWSAGTWELPGVSVPVDEELAAQVLQAHKALQEDQAAHVREHSLEVVVPFLYALEEATRIVPVAVAERDPDTLLRVGEALADVVSAQSEPVSVVVSSDMSHFIPADKAKQKDELALKAICEVNPEGLLETVQKNSISMCGVLPMTVGLSLARKLGCTQGELVEYANSGDFIGDYDSVVGYAGVVIW
ncbi:MAG: AmmeMemoRadiSam system protein B [Desulfohalobiaceae bacterium]|nr:AmmeMemoRadiSam system protein B [Desulfohalobiaceae bacterium]